MKYLSSLFVAFILLLTNSLPAQVSDRRSPLSDDEKQVELAKLITKDGLHRHLSILASDEYQGRETGEEGQKMAAKYIAGVFESYGLPVINKEGSYYQHFSYIAENWKVIDLKVNGRAFTHLQDYYAFPSKNSNKEISAKEILFLGYGIDDTSYSDYKGVDTKGKVLLVFAGEPFKNGQSLISKSSTPSEWTTDVNKKLRAAKAHGVEAILIVSDDFKTSMRVARKTINSRVRKMGWSENAADNYANSCFVSPKMAKEIFGKGFKKVLKLKKKIDKKGKPRHLTAKAAFSLRQEKKVRALLGENVVGIIEGIDPKLKDEYVFVTAHYDHLGVKFGKIFNGADDNGSGSSSLLMIAKAFAEAKKKGWGPRRTVVIMLVSGEEKGLLGSKYYVEHPLIPLEKTVVDINVDMVGRLDKRHEGNPNYVYVIGSNRLSTELHEIGEEANKKFTKLELDYKYNAEDDPNRYYYRSDHYNFAEKGIPSVFYFNGTHADYHKSTDTVEKIDFEAMANRAKLVFHTAWEIANRDKRIEVDVK